MIEQLVEYPGAILRQRLMLIAVVTAFFVRFDNRLFVGACTETLGVIPQTGVILKQELNLISGILDATLPYSLRIT
jgi:hypothetical protein